jgi:hypothetical protein
MKKVLIRGPLLCNCGYGIHSRQVYKWLLSRQDIKIYTQLISWGNNPWILDTSRDLIKSIVENSITKSESIVITFDETYQVQLPTEWSKISDFDVGITAGVESNICNVKIISQLNKMKKVVVPSNFSRDCFINTAKKSNLELTTDIVVVPESFDNITNDNQDDMIHYNIEFKTDNNYLVFGQMNSLNENNDRKNTFKTVKTLLETFRDDENVGIVLKTNAGNNSSLSRKVCKESIETFFKINKVDKVNRKCKFYLIVDNLNTLQLRGLYTHEKIDALVSGTRAEGFGLVHLEAAMNYLPIISTGWSGYNDFLGNSYLKVAFDLKACSNNSHDIFSKDSKWAEFRRESMIKKLATFNDKKSMFKQQSIELSNIIKQNYNINKIIEEYTKNIEVS